MRQVNKRAIENLARAGAFDCVEPNRAMVLKNASLIQNIGTLAAQERDSAQVSLFGDATVEIKDPDLEWAEPWSQMDSLGHELGAVGFYLGGHPLDEHMDKLSGVMLAERLEEAGAGNYSVAGVVRKKQERVSKRGKRFAFVELSDPTGDYEILFSENVLSTHRDKLVAGNIITVQVKAERNEGETRLFADGVKMLTGMSESPSVEKAPSAPAGLKIRLRQADIQTLDELKATLETLRNSPYQMSGYIELILPLSEKREAAWRLDGRWAIDPSIRKAIKANSAVETIMEIAA
jgi:DNA polymerase-3 subunit alpha